MLHLALLLAAQFAADAPPSGTFDGRCSYPGAVRERAADTGTVLAICNRVIVAEGGIAFVTRGTGQQMQYRGHWNGDRLTVDAIVLRGREPEEARGLCQRYEADDRLSMIASRPSPAPPWRARAALLPISSPGAFELPIDRLRNG